MKLNLFNAYPVFLVGIIMFVAALTAVPSANAFGITTPYWDDQPLRLYPGQSQDTELLLQNMVGEQDITVTARIIEGAEIASLIDKNPEYVVPFGRKDIVVPVRISIPKNITGTGEVKYRVGISFTQNQGGEGMVQLGTGVKTYIPVVIETGNPPSDGKGILETLKALAPNPMFIGGVVMVLLLLALYLANRKKPQKL